MFNSLIILVLLFVIESLYFHIANRYNIIDRPNLRSSHTHITLRGGGIIFPIGAWVFAVFNGFEYPLFLAGLTAIATISFWDDVHSVPNRVRLVIHFAAMLLMLGQWGLFTSQPWWYVLPALIVCTGIINAYNFMDGINGITGGYSLAVLVPLWIINTQDQYISNGLIISIILSVFVFCLFNFRKRAKCFAGDVGSVSIAFIILFILGMLIVQTQELWYIIFLVVYGVDSVLTIIHRLLLKENIFEAHRKHAYQLMANELKIPHTIISTAYMSVQLLISFGAIWLPINKWIYLICTIIFLTISYICFKRKYYHLHEAHLASLQRPIN